MRSETKIISMEVHKISHQRLRHCAFSREEDQTLRNLVNQHGTDAWPEVAKYMTRRSARQCRERWSVLMKRENSNRPFTPDEDHLLVTKCMQIGPKWQILERFFVDRTRICLKNRWQTLMKRAETESMIHPVHEVATTGADFADFVDFDWDDLDLFTVPTTDGAWADDWNVF